MDIKEFENLLQENEKNLEKKYKDIIYIHRRKRNGTKYNTYLQNFNLDKEESKIFMSNIKEIINSSCSLKKDKEFDEEKKVYIFNGDCQEIIKNILVKEYKIDEDRIKFSG